jgi:hypothetical protein
MLSGPKRREKANFPDLSSSAAQTAPSGRLFLNLLLTGQGHGGKNLSNGPEKDPAPRELFVKRVCAAESARGFERLTAGPFPGKGFSVRV